MINGTFANQILFSTGSNSHPSSIAIGDFNSDKVDFDLAVTNYVTKNVDILVGNGMGTFATTNKL